MKHLFVARHGHYDKYGDGKLTETGKEQIKTLGDAIKGILQDTSPILISSDRGRAVESSEILTAHLGISPDFEKVIWLFDKYRENFEAMATFLRDRQEDAVIAMGHQPFVEDFPKSYPPEFQGERPRLPRFSVKNGQAVYFNPEQGTYQLIP